MSLGDLTRGGLVVETLTHLALALTTVPAVAMVVFFVFGAHAFVGSVHALGTFGGIVVGSALGGVVASTWGVTAPFWFAGSAVFVVLIWGQLSHIAHEDEDPTAS